MRQSSVILMTLTPCVLVATAAFVFFATRLEQRVTSEEITRASELSRLRKRVDSLEAELESVREERRAVPITAVQKPVGKTLTGVAPPEFFEDRIDRLEKAVATIGSSPHDPEIRPEFLDTDWVSEGQKQKIRTVLDEVRDEEHEEKERKRQAREEKRTRKRVDALRERLALSDLQADEMTRILLDESEARRSAFVGVRLDGDWGSGTGGDRTLIVDAMKETREQRDGELARVLDPWQVDEFAKSEREKRRGGFGRGRDRESGRRGGRRDNGG